MRRAWPFGIMRAKADMTDIAVFFELLHVIYKAGIEYVVEVLFRIDKEHHTEIDKAEDA